MICIANDIEIPAFVVHHICALNLHKSLHFHTSVFSMLFCSDNCIHSIFIVCTSCSLMHDPCIFLCKKRGGTKQNKKKKQNKIEQKESHTTFLVTCVGYHDNGYKPTMLGLYTHFSRKKFENHVNVVPNAWLTRKMMVPRASYINLIIVFAMHSLSMP